MTKFLRKSLTAAAVAAALAAGSAGAADTKPAAPAAHAAPAAAAAPAVDKAAIDAKFKGDKKAEYSYMVGMDVGRGLSSIKDDIDVNVVIKALEATLKGEKTTLTEPEALAVRQDFMEKLRGEQQAKMKAEAVKNQKDGDDFLAKNKAKKGVKVTASGLQYEVVKEGKGAKPVKTDSVTVNYVGTKIDGTDTAGNKITLPSVSKNNINLIGYYEAKKFGVRLVYNWRDKYDLAAGNSFVGDARTVKARSQLDASASYQITDSLTVSVDAFNLTDATRSEYENDPMLPRRIDYDGRTYQVTMRAKF